MNMTQIQTTLGPILGLVAGYFAAWWGIDQASALGILTALCGLIYAGYNAFITSKTGIVKAAAAMPEVKEIKLDPSQPATIDMNSNTPSNVSIG